MSPIVQSLKSLLCINSITGNERELCDWTVSDIAARLGSFFAKCKLTRVGNSLVFFGPHESTRPTITLAGHFDTVSGTDFGDKVQLTQDKVIGLGASDMKAGLAVMLELLSPQLLQASPFNIAMIFYDGEEGPDLNNGIHAVFKQCPELKISDFAFVLEPTDNTLQLGCVGSIHAKILFHGKRGHSARPWEGINAIHLASNFMQRVSSLAPKKIEIGGLEFVDVYSITSAQSGDNSRNVVPDKFELNLNVRFNPNSNISETKKAILNLVSGEASVDFVDQAPSAPVPSDNKFYLNFRDKFKLKTLPKQAYTDVAVFAQHGVNAINFGPGLTSQAHQKGEYVKISDLERSLEIYKTYLLQG